MAEGTVWLAGQTRMGRSAAQAVADLAGAPGWSMDSAAACWREWLRGLGSALDATSRRERLAVAVEQREALAEQAWKNGDLRMALAAWDSRDRFLGLLDRDADDNQHAALTLARLMELARQPG